MTRRAEHEHEVHRDVGGDSVHCGNHSVLTWVAMLSRRPWLGLALLSSYGLAFGLLLGAGTGCGGAPSRLVTVKAGTGEGDIQFEVKNLTDVPINNFYLARTTSIPEQVDDNSPEAQSIWGGDL